MPEPEFKFSQEKMTLTITNLTGGWRFGDLGELKLFDHAELQFPSSWSQFKIGAASTILDAQWRIHGRLLVEQSLSAGIEYTLKDGTGGSMESNSALVMHLLERPTASLNLKLDIQLEGTATRQGFEGSAVAGLYLGGRF